MKRFLLLPAILAALFTGALALTDTGASAQIGIDIGPGGPRVYDRGPPPPPYYERRRRVYEEEECRYEIRRRVNRYGETVERRVRVCD